MRILSIKQRTNTIHLEYKHTLEHEFLAYDFSELFRKNK